MGFGKERFMEDRQMEGMEDFRPVRFFKTEVSKQNIADSVEWLVEKVDTGEMDPLKALASLNAIAKIAEETRKRIMDYAEAEFDKYHEKEITVLGSARVTKKEAGVRYDFSNTEAWCEIKAREDEIANERKALEATLKTFTKPGMMSIDDEMIEVNPPIRTSTTVIQVEIK